MKYVLEVRAVCCVSPELIRSREPQLRVLIQTATLFGISFKPSGKNVLLFFQFRCFTD
uniref:Uncharacterized protein n=1 Tax=Anguilla anguilla TaxID=7936 RepID=A0A0E9SKF5_ANGAN